MLICGIDIGKNYHEACVIDETGRQLAKTLRFPNTTAGAGTLMDYFHGCNPDKQTIVVGMEAKGHYWLSLYCFLFDQGLQVNVINPLQSDAVRNLFLRKAKNEPKTAFSLPKRFALAVSATQSLQMKIFSLCASSVGTAWIW